MPILTLDHRGQLMESDPDRGDGKGYKGQVSHTLQGDVYLGDAALRSSLTQEEMDTRSKAAQHFTDAAEVGMGRELRRQKILKNRKQYLTDRVRQTQEVQDQLTREGAHQSMMGCDEVDVNQITGNGLTADGAAMPANPSMDIVPVDPVELKAQIMQSLLFNQLCQEAQSGSQMVAYDSGNAAAQPAQVDIQAQTLDVMKAAAKPVAVNYNIHPMLALLTR